MARPSTRVDSVVSNPCWLVDQGGLKQRLPLWPIPGAKLFVDVEVLLGNRVCSQDDFHLVLRGYETAEILDMRARRITDEESCG